MAKMEGLAHMGLFITDMEKSLAFYKNVLEFDTIWECALDEADGTQTKVAFIQNGNLVIEVVQRECPEQRADGWVDHIALAVEDIEAVRTQLEERGVVFESKEPVFNGKVFPHGSKWLTFRGPDGEHLEITEVLRG